MTETCAWNANVVALVLLPPTFNREWIMAAGISREQERRANHRNLKRIERVLRRAGVTCRYEHNALRGDGFDVMFRDAVRCGNGEAFPNLHVAVDGKEYFFLEGQHGIERIRALFGDPEERARLPISDLTWMIILIERAVSRLHETQKKEDDLFLYDASGQRVETEPGPGMESGQLYAYNQMKDDKPMVRIGPDVGPDCYTELRPGMSVRCRDGRIVVRRPL
jgi:hypothetical protein